MGLKEKRALRDFQEKAFPGLMQQVQEAAGFAVEVAVDWESLAEDDKSHLYEECFPQVYFLPLIAALKSITADDLGQEGLKEILTMIKIENREGIYSPRGFTFNDGILLLDHQPCTNPKDQKDREEKIQSILENAM